MNAIKYKYKIMNKTPLGKGMFSTVYHAENENKHPFAIKCISLDKLTNTDKFLLELDISMKMKHRNIVKAYEVFKTSKHWYIVCEYCDNGTLCNIIDILKTGKYSYSDRELIAKKYLTQLKNALKYLYKNNIVHRDLKPSNILIQGSVPNDILKLADFGFSRYFENNDLNNDLNTNDNLNHDNKNMMNSFCGTPLYMAPELLKNKNYTNSADLWSFGIIMYELLYGINPYNYPLNIGNLIYLMENQEINFEPLYSSDCIDLLKSLLKIDPSNRISWDNFFSHQWFDNLIPSGFSKDSLHGSTDNLQTIIENSTYDLNNYDTSLIKYCSKDIIEIEEEYDIINKKEIKQCSYSSCHEQEEKFGILRILTNSVYKMFGSS